MEVEQTMEGATITEINRKSVTVESTGTLNTSDRQLNKSKQLSDTSGIVIGPAFVDENDSIIPTLQPVSIGPAIIVPVAKPPSITESKMNGGVISSNLSLNGITKFRRSENSSVLTSSTHKLHSNLKNTKSDPCVFSPNKTIDLYNNNFVHLEKKVSWDETVLVSDGWTADVIEHGLQKEDHEYSPKSHDDLRPPDDYYGSVLDAKCTVLHKKLLSQRMGTCILTFIAILLLLAVITMAFIISWK